MVDKNSSYYDAWIQQLTTENPSMRVRAVFELGESRDPRYVPYLMNALKDKDDLVREWAAHSLDKIGDAQAVPALIEALADESVSVRLYATEALLNIGEPRAIPALIEALKDIDAGVRLMAVYALQMFCDPQAVPALIDTLTDNIANVRIEAAWTLGHIGDPRAIPALTHLSNKVSDAAHRVAKEALTMILISLKDVEVVGARNLKGMIHADRSIDQGDLVFAKVGPSHHSPARLAEIKRIYQMEQKITEKLSSPGGEELADQPGDAVHFSVTSLPVVLAKSKFILDVWAHLGAQTAEVARKARKALGADKVAMRTEGPVPIWPGTMLVIKLKIGKMKVKNPEAAILWNGEIAHASFAVQVRQNTKTGDHAGTASVYVDGLRVARVNFLIKVGEAVADAQVLPATAHYIHKAFASYASEDRADVLARIQGMQKVLPTMEIFLDVLSLRSGQDWEKELWRVIPDPATDVFYLFWSRNAKESEWVEKEWRCALKTRGLDYIDPVPLVPPDDAPPPKELAGKHFNDWELAFIRASKQK